ncbi:MAG: hypothetical protein LBB21_03065 [Holosporaceae bacterium]|nr:hypothetical protein [Holosporaceae bacterium]
MLFDKNTANAGIIAGVTISQVSTTSIEECLNPINPLLAVKLWLSCVAYAGTARSVSSTGLCNRSDRSAYDRV